ncbi:pre-rRNA-processing protein esf1 [Coemansia sp. RSA 2671]|uniref:Pre-rRNA-processing protein esf1 n=1 Tax=Coemansia linderi TaxID=2663919 RepID=A0ACC1K9R2_9FUNG|nr:pre-rRNA-processing protein esf1 [Coemansia sp. RSA 2675]KAJ2350110.1 pre-rRNA-processing protein esf1 [Coemansia sp. RSA 2671]KAJ2369036.1 pre-rRNA-processing protein esf1 [Coemansia sp. RSA 2611]KAJ2776887.1 pre-rRNA-processing protein esf1 [Coemansia linderi]
MAPPKEGRKGAPVVKVTDDSRFAHVQNDPRFIRPKKASTKVKVDKRFSHMIKDKDFTETTKVDKYGQKQEDNRAETYLRNAYEFSGSESESESGSESESQSEGDSESRVVDRARGRGVVSEDSSDSELDSDISDVEWGTVGGELSDEEEPEEVPRGDETKRFACVNMDWEHVRAVDLLTVFSAFKPDGGSVVAVNIYPSEFGKERMSKEAIEGPPRDIFAKTTKQSDSDDEGEEEDLVKEQLDDNEEFDQVALRKYEMEKMRYYFAVIECDSIATAQAIYSQCDGTEYEASANFFDLRFIPDDMDFDDKPKDQAMHVPEKYEPLDFSTQALQHSKVKLTWDADEPTRMKMTRRAFTQDEIDTMDFGNLLASSSDSSSDDDEDLAKKRALLLARSDSEEESDTGEMEITFTPGLSEAASRSESKRDEEVRSSNENTIDRFRRLKKERREKWKESKKTPKNDDNLISDNEIDSRTAGDKFFTYSDDDQPMGAKKGKKVRESKVERKQRLEAEAKERAELELLVDHDSKHFDMSEIVKAEKSKKSKGRKRVEKVEDDFKLNTSDPRFGALFESHNFAIDPNNPNFKKTKAMKELLSESRKRRKTFED